MTTRDVSGDHELIGALRRGESRGVELLVDRYGAWIHRVASRMLADSRDAVLLRVRAYRLVAVVRMRAEARERRRRSRS